MKPANLRCVLVALNLFGGVLLADQASKAYLIDWLSGPFVTPIKVTWFFNLVMVWNYGISFGMFAQHDAAYILIGVAVVICSILAVWLWRTADMKIAVAIGLITGGAIGNVFDRLQYGAVADFFDFHVLGYHWPAFNIADMAIFIGVVILCWDSMLGKHHSGQKTR